MMTTDNSSENRITHLPSGKFAPGNNANPLGRPKGKTMKEYSREWFLNLTDEQKTAYILELEKVRPGFAWTMAEGSPTEDRNITITVPKPILGGVAMSELAEGSTAQLDSAQSQTEAIQDTVIHEVIDSASSDTHSDNA